MHHGNECMYVVTSKVCIPWWNLKVECECSGAKPWATKRKAHRCWMGQKRMLRAQRGGDVESKTRTKVEHQSHLERNADALKAEEYM